MTLVKICGVKTAEQAIGAAEAGADFIGLVFAKSPREVTPAQAKAIVTALKKKTARVPQIVGVFVNAPASLVTGVADLCGLDMAQLSGDETWEYCRDLSRPVIKVIRLARKYKATQVIAGLEQGEKILGKQKHLFLLDSYEKEKYGGTGRPFDWGPARPIFDKFRAMLAGGLTPENVAGAVKTLRPFGVDVSSGVETNGIKDMDKIRKFIQAVREGDGG